MSDMQGLAFAAILATTAFSAHQNAHHRHLMQATL
jgi:hypothetical protein